MSRIVPKVKTIALWQLSCQQTLKFVVRASSSSSSASLASSASSGGGAACPSTPTPMNQEPVCPKVRTLKEAICEKIPSYVERIKELRTNCGNAKIGSVTVNQVFGGMRGMTALICETSEVDPDNGIRFRGRSIEDCQATLPRACENGQPLPESLYWLLCTGDVPSAEEVSKLSCEWSSRAGLPQHVACLLNNMPKTLHPMAQLSCAVCALSHDSRFAKEYMKGVKKDQYWELVYEDATDLIAKLPVICATIYTNTYKADKAGKADMTVSPSLDWTGNFMKMMGFDDPAFNELMRLYLVLHSDHEGGNVSAHAVHLVGSALADPFLAYAAGMNGLAGPLHGLANQEVLIWLTKMKEEIGGEPDEAKVKAYVEKTLKEGKVVPGYGHAVLRKTDPRFTAFHEFAKKYKSDHELVKMVDVVYKVVPDILKSGGKVKNPWPNVDGSSGALLSAFGLTEMTYYTVLFALSRALGTMAQLIWARALGFPIERPKSVTLAGIAELVEKANGKDEKPAEKASCDKPKENEKSKVKCAEMKQPEKKK